MDENVIGRTFAPMIYEAKAIHTASAMTALVDEVGFLPLLDAGWGWSAEEAADDEAQYVHFPEGGWEWPLWEWKGEIVRESGCAYGKFFRGKAGFVSRRWWADFCLLRRSLSPAPEAGSVEAMILDTLRGEGTMLSRDLRAACGFTGRQRGVFEGCVARLQAACRIVTDDFIYPRDRHGRPYGWGWAQLTTAEARFGRAACRMEGQPEEARRRMRAHLETCVRGVGERALRSVIG